MNQTATNRGMHKEHQNLNQYIQNSNIASNNRINNDKLVNKKEKLESFEETNNKMSFYSLKALKLGYKQNE